MSLRAKVAEAMRAELKRQSEAPDVMERIDLYGDPDPNLQGVEGYIDLDALAGVALMAMPAPVVLRPNREGANTVFITTEIERGGQFTTDDEALINLFTQAQKEQQRLSDAFLKDTLGAHFDLPVEGRSYRVVSREGYLRRSAPITFRIEEAK